MENKRKIIFCDPLTSNIEAGEYSYVQEAGGKAKLEEKVGHSISHFKLDLRFELNDVVVLIETKQNYVDDDEHVFYISKILLKRKELF